MCRKTLNVRLNEKSSNMVDKLRRDVSEAPAVCTTADIWSCMCRSYLGVTAHWIDDDLTRQSAALACCRLKGSHTFDIVADSLITVHNNYGLDHRSISFTVTDNGANMVKAFAEYQEPDTSVDGSSDLSDSDDDDDESVSVEFSDMSVVAADVDVILSDSDKSLESSFLPKHMRCASHTLNLVASTDFNKLVADESNRCKRLIQSAFAKCSQLWNNVSRSTKSSDSAVEILGISLRTPGETRWNSTFDAVKRLLEPRVRQKLAQLMDTLKLPQFSKIEIEILEEYVKFMGPIAIALDRLQGESQCYLGLLMPTIQQVHKKILSCSSTLSHSSLLAQALAKAVKVRLPRVQLFQRK